MLSLVWLALVQDPFPRPGADPTGVVIDEQGKKIVGATVELVRDAHVPDTWSLSIDQVLRQNPLPRGITNKDGEFVLPLTRDQRRLGAAGEGRFALIVRKDGYQRWCEPLSQGLAGYLGSRVLLRTLRDDDRVTIVVDDPVPGMFVLLQRTIRDDPDPGSCVPVPENGKLTLTLPLAPSPPVLTGSMWATVGLEARVLYPGRSGALLAIDPEKENRIVKHSLAATSFAFKRTDGHCQCFIRIDGGNHFLRVVFNRGGDKVSRDTRRIGGRLNFQLPN